MCLDRLGPEKPEYRWWFIPWRLLFLTFFP